MARSVRIVRKSRDWAKKLEKKIRAFTSKEVVAGYPKGKSESAQTYDNGASVLDVAIWNQFGADNPGGQPFYKNKKGEIVYVRRNHPKASKMAKTKPFKIPARPFIDEASYVVEVEKKGEIAAIAKQVITGDMPARQGLKLIGLVGETAIRESIGNSIMYEPNKSSTIRKKKSRKPLVNTGKLTQAVTSIVRDKGE